MNETACDSAVRTPAAELQPILNAFGMPVAVARCVNVSENQTFRIDSPQGKPLAVLRIYRAQHREEAEIRSELDWMEALCVAGDVRTPSILRTMSGDRLCPLFASGGSPRICVVFEFLQGSEPPENERHKWFRRLGVVSAKLHGHGAAWNAPEAFRRPHLDWEALVGERAVWGPRCGAPGLDADAEREIVAAAALLRESLAEFDAQGLTRGLIHGDLRLANLLVDGEDLALIDFDDCAFAWHLFDVATSLSLIEDDPQAPELLNAWVDGYTRVKSLAASDLRSIPHLIMLRRIQVLSWFAGHADTDVTRTHGPAVVAGTIAAARQYLDGRIPFAADLGLPGTH